MKTAFEPSNKNLIDDEEYSNFRVFGIGKPSDKQIERMEKRNPEKVQSWVDKGIISSDQTTVDDGKKAALIKGLRGKLKSNIKENLSNLKTVDIDVAKKSDEVSPSSESTESYEEEKSFFKTKTGAAVIVVGGIALLVGGYFLVKKLKK